MGFFDPPHGPLYNPTASLYRPPRRKVFISYHHADEDEVAAFRALYQDVAGCFISRGINAGMPGDVIDSSNPDYVMGRIRALHLRDSTVTIVMIGIETWARRFVDWELQASLRRPSDGLPNGVLGIKLPSCQGADYPDRLNKNLLSPQEIESGEACYARVHSMPANAAELTRWIEEAFTARTARAHLIDNPRDRMRYNKSVPFRLSRPLS